MFNHSDIIMAHGKDILKNISVSPECVSQIKRTLVNRPKELFSNTMSEEARMAMKMAAEDSKRHKKSRRHEKKSDDPCSKSKDRKNGQAKSWGSSSQNPVEKIDSLKKQPSYTELFQKNSTLRLEGDITDENYSESKLRKRAVGGGRIESAMETIVILNADDPKDIDDIAIEETAKLNSVEKCLVWMELHDVEEMSGRISPMKI